jgi:hypothetical protein
MLCAWRHRPLLRKRVCCIVTATPAAVAKARITSAAAAESSVRTVVCRRRMLCHRHLWPRAADACKVCVMRGMSHQHSALPFTVLSWQAAQAENAQEPEDRFIYNWCNGGPLFMFANNRAGLCTNHYCSTPRWKQHAAPIPQLPASTRFVAALPMQCAPGSAAVRSGHSLISNLPPWLIA